SRQPERGRQVNFERVEIAAVRANQIAPGVERALQFAFVVDLTQNVQVISLSAARKRSQVILLESSNDQQDGIRAMRSRFQDLEVIDDEVFAQTGKGSRG